MRLRSHLLACAVLYPMVFAGFWTVKGCTDSRSPETVRTPDADVSEVDVLSLCPVPKVCRCEPVPQCPPAPSCPSPQVVQCGWPDAMCLEVEAEPASDLFSVRFAFYDTHSRVWLASPTWTDLGLRFGAELGLRLDRGDRYFLRHGGGRPSFPDMTLRLGTQGNLSYRFAGASAGDVDLLVCGEIDWSQVVNPNAGFPDEPDTVDEVDEEEER